MQARRRRRKNAFLEQKGLCWWCLCEMVYFDRVPKDKKRLPNLCTLEHLDSRNNPQRGLFSNKMVRRVAACLECNQMRGNSGM